MPSSDQTAADLLLAPSWGFRRLLWAQYLSSVADNALFMVCIAWFASAAAPVWMPPAIKFAFVLPYVLLAPMVGAWADAWPKSQVMFWANALKIVACVGLMCGVAPLAACVLTGLAAAVYSPAKYGLLAEQLPAKQLVVANAWIEGLTIAAIIMGTALGGWLTQGATVLWLQQGVQAHSVLGQGAWVVLILLYAMSGWINRLIPLTAVSPPPRRDRLSCLGWRGHVREFIQTAHRLWGDPVTRVALAVGTLFWGVCAALQLLILDWSAQRLALTLAQSSLLLGVLALSVAVGAALAARFVPVSRALAGLPLGVLMGGVAMLLVAVHTVWMMVALLAVAGTLGGYLVVPMYALLQRQGQRLAGSGQVIAVQNCSENLSVLIMMLLYGSLRAWGVSLSTLILGFGGLIILSLLLIQRDAKSCKV